MLESQGSFKKILQAISDVDIEQLINMQKHTEEGKSLNTNFLELTQESAGNTQ